MIRPAERILMISASNFRGTGSQPVCTSRRFMFSASIFSAHFANDSGFRFRVFLPPCLSFAFNSPLATCHSLALSIVEGPLPS